MSITKDAIRSFPNGACHAQYILYSSNDSLNLKKAYPAVQNILSAVPQAASKAFASLRGGLSSLERAPLEGDNEKKISAIWRSFLFSIKMTHQQALSELEVLKKQAVKKKIPSEKLISLCALMGINENLEKKIELYKRAIEEPFSFATKAPLGLYNAVMTNQLIPKLRSRLSAPNDAFAEETFPRLFELYGYVEPTREAVNHQLSSEHASDFSTEQQTFVKLLYSVEFKRACLEQLSPKSRSLLKEFCQNPYTLIPSRDTELIHTLKLCLNSFTQFPKIFSLSHLLNSSDQELLSCISNSSSILFSFFKENQTEANILPLMQLLKEPTLDFTQIAQCKSLITSLLQVKAVLLESTPLADFLDQNPLKGLLERIRINPEIFTFLENALTLGSFNPQDLDPSFIAYLDKFPRIDPMKAEAPLFGRVIEAAPILASLYRDPSSRKMLPAPYVEFISFLGRVESVLISLACMETASQTNTFNQVSKALLNVNEISNLSSYERRLLELLPHEIEHWPTLLQQLSPSPLRKFMEKVVEVSSPLLNIPLQISSQWSPLRSGFVDLVVNHPLSDPPVVDYEILGASYQIFIGFAGNFSPYQCALSLEGPPSLAVSRKNPGSPNKSSFFIAAETIYHFQHLFPSLKRDNQFFLHFQMTLLQSFFDFGLEKAVSTLGRGLRIAKDSSSQTKISYEQVNPSLVVANVEYSFTIEDAAQSELFSGKVSYSRQFQKNHGGPWTQSISTPIFSLNLDLPVREFLPSTLKSNDFTKIFSLLSCFKDYLNSECFRDYAFVREFNLFLMEKQNTSSKEILKAFKELLSLGPIKQVLDSLSSSDLFSLLPFCKEVAVAIKLSSHALLMMNNYPMWNQILQLTALGETLAPQKNGRHWFELQTYSHRHAFSPDEQQLLAAVQKNLFSSPSMEEIQNSFYALSSKLKLPLYQAEFVRICSQSDLQLFRLPRALLSYWNKNIHSLLESNNHHIPKLLNDLSDSNSTIAFEDGRKFPLFQFVQNHEMSFDDKSLTCTTTLGNLTSLPTSSKNSSILAGKFIKKACLHFSFFKDKIDARGMKYFQGVLSNEIYSISPLGYLVSFLEQESLLWSDSITVSFSEMTSWGKNALYLHVDYFHSIQIFDQPEDAPNKFIGTIQFKHRITLRKKDDVISITNSISEDPYIEMNTSNNSTFESVS